MARQGRTTAEEMQVNNDFDVFFLPTAASLDLGELGAYGTTDTSVDLSLVNIRHLNAYTQFRGMWVTSPTDGNNSDGNPLSIPFVENDVVYSTTNNVVYRRSSMNPTTNPDPATALNTGEWVAMGIQVNETINEDAGAPGIFLDGTTLNFRGYRSGQGVEVDNATGVIRASQFALTNVRVYDTFANLRAATDVEWHLGDVAVVTGIAPQDPDIDDGEGSYVYDGTTNGNGHMGATAINDWQLLALPHDVVHSIGGLTGTLTADQVATVVAPEINLGELGNVSLSSPAGGQHLTYNATSEMWENNDAGETSLELNDISDVNITSAAANNLIQRNDGNTEWVNTTPQTVVGDTNLDDHSDVPAAEANHLLLRNSANDAWTNFTASELVGRTDLEDHEDVNFRDANNISTLVPGDLLVRGTNEWVNEPETDFLGRQTLNRIGDVEYGQSTSSTSYSLLVNRNTPPVTAEIQIQNPSINEIGISANIGHGSLNVDALQIGDIIYLTTQTAGVSFDPTATDVYGPFNVVRIGAHSFSIPYTASGGALRADGFINSQERAIINAASYNAVVARVVTIPGGRANGHVLTWDESLNNGQGGWINRAASAVTVGNVPMDMLQDVTYDADVISNLYPVALRSDSRDAAVGISFTGDDPVGVDETVTLFANAARNINFEAGDFTVNDRVYFSENAPPIESPVQGPGQEPFIGPIIVTGVVNNNPQFRTGTASGTLPISAHGFINNADSNYYAYIEVPTTTTVRPADVLVRSADGNQWVNETADQMAANPNGGIQLQSLRNVESTTPTANQQLIYNSVTNQWEPERQTTYTSNTDGTFTVGQVGETAQIVGVGHIPINAGISTIPTRNEIKYVNRVDIDDHGHITRLDTTFAEPATATATGLMPNTDKAKLDNIPSAPTHEDGSSTNEATTDISSGESINYSLRVTNNAGTLEETWDPADLDSLNNVQAASPVNGNHLVYNGTNWVPGTANITTESLEDLSDTAMYPTRTYYTSAGALLSSSAAAAVTFTSQPDFTDEDNLFFIENRDDVTNNNVASWTSEQFALNSTAGPYHLVQTVANPLTYDVFRPGRNNYDTGDQATIQSELAAVLTTNSGPVIARRNTAALGPLNPGEIIQWHQSNRVTGAGEWQYVAADTLDTTYSFANGSGGDFMVTPEGGSAQTVDIGVHDWAKANDTTTDIEVGHLGNVPILAWVSGTEYNQNDLVTNAGIVWRALRTTPTGDQATAPAEGNNWTEIGAGLDELREIGNVYITSDPAAGQHLIWDVNAGGTGVGGWVAHNSGTNTSIRLNDLNDATITNPMNGQHLVYNNGVWMNHDGSETSIALDDISDVTISRDPSETIARTTSSPAIVVGSATGNGDPDFDVRFTTAHGLSLGDTISFVTSTGTEREQIFTVNTRTDAQQVQLRNRDGSDTAAAFISGLVGDTLQTVTVTPTTTRMADGELLVFNRGATEADDEWINQTPAEAGLISGINLFDASTPLTPVDGIVNLPLATPEADGLMSQEDKEKLDEYTTAPVTVNGGLDEVSADNPNIAPGESYEYALRRARAADGTNANDLDEYSTEWVRFSEIMAQDNLIFDETTDPDSVTLTQYRRENGMVETVRSVNALASAGAFVINFARFDPQIQAVTGPATLAWDAPYNRAATDFRLRATNDPDVQNQFLSTVRTASASGTTNSGITLSSFDAVTPLTAYAPLDQSLNLITGNIFDATGGEDMTGGSTRMTFTYTEQPSGNAYSSDSTYDIRWGNIGFDTTRVASPGIDFYQNIHSVEFTARLSGLSNSANGGILVTDTDDIFDNFSVNGGTTTNFSRLGSSALEYRDRAYKDASPTGNLTAVYTATRPITVTGLTTPTPVTRTDTTSDWSTGTVTRPGFNFNTTDIAVRPSAYASTTTAGAILTGTWTDEITGSRVGGLARQSGVDRFTGTSNDFPVNPTANTYYWFGVSGGTAPTVVINTGLGFLPATNTITETVTFSTTTLSGSSVPSGWTDETYTFIRVLVNGGVNATIRVT